MVSVGEFSTPAFSDGSSRFVAGRDSASIFTDGSPTPRTARLPPTCRVRAAAAATALVSCDDPQSSGLRPQLLDLQTGVIRPIPDPRLLTLPADTYGFSSMGSRWLLGSDCQGSICGDSLLAVEWHTGAEKDVNANTALFGRIPSTALNTPGLTSATTTPYLTATSTGVLVYRRHGHRQRTVRGCRRCDQAAVSGWHVAALQRSPLLSDVSRGIPTAVLSINMRTRKVVQIPISRFGPGAGVTLQVTRRRLILSLYLPNGLVSVKTVAWPN